MKLILLTSFLIGTGAASCIFANARSGWFFWSDFVLTALGLSVGFAIFMAYLT
jgi:hypothetical protein